MEKTLKKKSTVNELISIEDEYLKYTIRKLKIKRNGKQKSAAYILFFI